MDTDKKSTPRYYMDESELYSLWIYSRPDFYPRRYFGFSEITLNEYGGKSTFDFIRSQLKKADVPFGNFESYSDNDYSKIDLPPTNEDTKDLSEKDLKNVKKAFDKFKNDEFTLKEFDVLYPHCYSLLDYFCVQPDLSKADQNKLNTHISDYIQAFMNNELIVKTKNHFVFNKQKQTLVNRMREMNALENYGNNFILTEDPRESGAFLFVHTLYALETLGYLNVIKLWKTQVGAYDYIISANILAGESLVAEVIENYKKENPKNQITGFDAGRGILSFANQKVALSKKSTKTDAVLLIESLMKSESGQWMFHDEILEDWGYNREDQKDLPKNKVYHAAQKANNKIVLKTGVEDFIECNTSKARINPKYSKVDE